MTEAQRIPVGEMLSMLNSDDATALLGELDVGPTWYDGAWWHVPAGELDQGFVRADDESSEEYYRMFRSLSRSAAILQEQFTSDEYDDLALESTSDAVDGGGQR